MNVAVITGASSGLGRVYADKVIQRYPHLDELWLVARREERLREMARQSEEMKIRPVVLDLTMDESYESLRGLLQAENPDIKVLINNAGFDSSDEFIEIPGGDITTMVDLNVKGLTMVDRLCIPYMNAGGIILHTSSVSSFMPIPYQAVYSATKAYVRFLGRALHEELKGKGVNVCTMCPGSMNTEMWKGREDASHLPFLDLDVITEKSLRYAELGRCIYTPGLIFKGIRVFSKLFPEAWTAKLVGGQFKSRSRSK